LSGEIIMNNDDTEWLREQMARVRSHLANDVGEVVEQAKEMADWRNHVRRHPWLFAGAAAALGFMIVPARRPKVAKPDMSVHRFQAALSENSGEPAKPKRASGTMQALVNLAAGIAVKSLMSVAGNQLQNLVVSRANGPPRSPDPWRSPRPGV
jgi:hypothetical protein